MKKSTKNILALSIVSAIIAVLLAVTNYITAPIIEEQEKAAVNAALSEVMPGAEVFSPVDIESLTLDKSVTEVYSSDNGGYVVRLNVTGYQPDMIILCGIGADGKVTGVTCISSGETLGEEKDYGNRFLGLDGNEASNVDTVTSATKTTAAYRRAVVTAIETAKTLSKGGTN